MLMDEHLYTAYKAKDDRFDGRFFVGISTTGIYCRSVCRAKLPKAENCTFYRTAAEAEHAGFRPCLLCRPELAPGSLVDVPVKVAHRIAKLLEENCGGGQSLEQLSERLGYTSRHLRRIFSAEYSVSPIQYLQTYRLLLAKSLLTDTDLSVLDIAMAAGFDSVRRFNDLFKKQYRLSPSGLRKSLPNGQPKSGKITLLLSYRPPYPFAETLRFFSERAIPGVETVETGAYMRTVCLANTEQSLVYGWIKIENRPEKNALSVTISETLLSVLPQVLAKVRHLFDLYSAPDVIYETLSAMNLIRPGLCVLGTRLSGSFSSFETAARAILEQQITVKAARTLTARLVAAFGTRISTGIAGLTHVFPSSDNILNLEGTIENRFGSLGIIASRARAVLELARALKNGELDLEICANPEAEMEKLKAIKGIGNWTARYIAMRAMGWSDAFLETDAAVKKALEPYTGKELLILAEAWRPWRSYATINLWNSLRTEK